MRKALFILLSCAGLCSAEQFCTFYNYSPNSFGTTLYFIQDIVEETGPSIGCKPGQTVSFPKSWGSFYLRDDVDTVGHDQVDDVTFGIDVGYISLDAPLIYYTGALPMTYAGSFDVDFLGQGFGLGLLVASFMLMLWIAALIRKPVAET